jgi:hypothetical protein
MLDDFERADRIGEFWATRRVAPLPSYSSTPRRTGRCERCWSTFTGSQSSG